MTDASAVDECYRCGYDLRGIADDQPCPECGLLAARSRRQSDELHNTRPKWLRRLSRGIWIILLSLLWLASLTWTIEILESSIHAFVGSLGLYLPSDLASFSACYLGVAGLVLGTVLLTSPEGDERADRGDRRQRIMIRVFAFAPLAGVVAAQVIDRWRVNQWRRGNYNTPLWLVELVPASFFTIGLIPFVILVFRHLKSLAIRARSPHLTEHCTIVGLGTSIAMLYVALLMAVDALSQGTDWATEWNTRSNVALALQLAASVAACLFFLWALYLLVRFAIAFHLAARRLRRKWADDDRAVGTKGRG